jgi:hypothetical protein
VTAPATTEVTTTAPSGMSAPAPAAPTTTVPPGGARRQRSTGDYQGRSQDPQRPGKYFERSHLGYHGFHSVAAYQRYTRGTQ